MIRIRLLTEPQWMEGDCFWSYSENQFYDLLREKEPFTDAESLALLQHLHGEAAVTEMWYSCTTGDGKPCLPAISREAMYGLVVIENSRKGRYTNFVEDFSGYEVEDRMEKTMGGDHQIPLVWQAFAQMKLDILLTYRKKDFSFAWDIPIDEEYVLENYPLQGVETEVHVVNEFLREPELRDGKWYVYNFFFDQRYWWGNDPAELLATLDNTFAGQSPLVKGTYTLEAFLALCCPWTTNDMGHFDETRQSEWKVINHMESLPADGESRRLQYLLVEEYSDGRFCLRDSISVKYPTYDELLWEAKALAKPDCNVFVLPVDVNECMGCAADIRKAVCAFRVSEGVIETFGPVEGLREFECTLQRAVASGNYSTVQD